MSSEIAHLRLFSPLVTPPYGSHQRPCAAASASQSLEPPRPLVPVSILAPLQLPTPEEVAASNSQHRFLGASAIGMGLLAVSAGAVGACLLGAGYATGVFNPALLSISLALLTIGIGSLCVGQRILTCDVCIPSMPAILDQLHDALAAQDESPGASNASALVHKPSPGNRAIVLNGLQLIFTSVKPTDADAPRALDIATCALQVYAQDVEVIDAALAVLFAMGDEAAIRACVSARRAVLLGHAMRIVTDVDVPSEFMRSACQLLPLLCAQAPENDDELNAYGYVYAEISAAMERLCRARARENLGTQSADEAVDVDVMLSLLKTLSVLQMLGVSDRYIAFNTQQALECYPDSATLAVGLTVLQHAVSLQRGYCDLGDISSFIRRFLPRMCADTTLRELAYNLWKITGEQTAKQQAMREYAWNELLNGAKV